MPKLRWLAKIGHLLTALKKTISISFQPDGGLQQRLWFSGHDRQIFLSKSHHNTTFMHYCFMNFWFEKFLLFEASLNHLCRSIFTELWRPEMPHDNLYSSQSRATNSFSFLTFVLFTFAFKLRKICVRTNNFLAMLKALVVVILFLFFHLLYGQELLCVIEHCLLVKLTIEIGSDSSSSHWFLLLHIFFWHKWHLNICYSVRKKSC